MTSVWRQYAQATRPASLLRSDVNAAVPRLHGGIAPVDIQKLSYEMEVGPVTWKP